MRSASPTVTWGEGCAVNISIPSPDVVAHPDNEKELAAALDWATGAQVAVVPYGGGSSVLGGTSRTRATAIVEPSRST